MLRSLKIFSYLTLAIPLAWADLAFSQDLDPRRYVNLPISQNFIALAYSYSEGELGVSESISLEDASIRFDGPALSYVRTFQLAGNASSLDILQPYACVAGNALLDGERVTGERCGFADTSLRITYNFIGAKALDIQEFRRRKRELVVGASIQVSMPTGDYDENKLLNTGANRWSIKPEIGVTVPINRWRFEFAAAARFFTDNDEYLETSRLEQDPVYTLQAHVNYDISRRQSVSVSSNYFVGGKTFRDGVQSAISQENSRLGLTWTYALTSRHLIKLLFHKGVVTRIGNDSDVVTAAWSYRWD